MLDAWARCLVALHQETEKPEQPIEFVEEFFSQKVRHELEELRNKVRHKHCILTSATHPAS